MISPFQLTSSADNKPAADNNKNTYCEWNGDDEPGKTHPAVEWYIKEVQKRKKALAEKLPYEFPELEANLMNNFTNFMSKNYTRKINEDDKLLRAMEQTRISSWIPPENIHSISNNEQVYRHEDNIIIGKLVEQVDSRVNNIVKEYFGEKDAELLKDISLGRNLLERVRTKCVQEANNNKHNVPGADAVGHDVTAPNVPNAPFAKSNNNAISNP